MTKGLFITFEGGEGSGKTTVINHVKDTLEQQGYDVLVTREPGGVAVAEDIRQILLYKEMDPMTEVLLFAGARNEHLRNVVIPALEKGTIVLCDRFVHSSYVYQGIVRGVGIEKVKDINDQVIGEYQPDLTVYLDVIPEIGLRRIQANTSRESNKLDEYDVTFHNRVSEGYLQVLSASQSPVMFINANQREEDVRDNTLVQVIAFVKHSDKGLKQIDIEYEYPHLRAIYHLYGQFASIDVAAECFNDMFRDRVIRQVREVVTE